MLVVWRDHGPDVGTPLLPLQPVEITAESNVEGSGKGDRMDSGQMPTSAGL